MTPSAKRIGLIAGREFQAAVMNDNRGEVQPRD